jgi:serine/threonine protein kinase/Flp pilus assembly protein TadD
MEECIAISPTLSHYRILSRLGAGGMGEVYLAEDTQLGRKVAIKSLPNVAAADAQARKRLIREAQAAAKLDHPNICSIYEVVSDDDRSFIVMQYVEGETLAKRIAHKPLELPEALDTALQLADAIAEAHSRGIIHRDIKPQNIMITARGQAKMLDFGLAKVVRESVSTTSEAETCSLLTDPGMIIGTVPYMSPEQLRGEPVDERSDLFSFGSVLYEMVTGRNPFGAESAVATISAILTLEPAPLARYAHDVPSELQRILHKTLEKDRDERYQSAGDLLVDLKNLKRDTESFTRVIVTEPVAGKRRSNVHRWALVMAALVAAALLVTGAYLLGFRPNIVDRPIDSVAVLPLANGSGDANAEYLSDGITENIINRLSQLPQLRVMARTTVFRYKGLEVDPQTAGRDLSVRAVVTGRVRRVGDSLEIQAELVDVSNGSQLWGQKYNRKLIDILAVQDEIASQISEKLRLKLGDQDKARLAKRYTDNPRAYELYLKGRYHLTKWTEQDFKTGLEYLKQAIAVEPRYALAYSGLAEAYSISPLTSPRESLRDAKQAANTALEIDETLAEAHASLAVVEMYLDWDWSGAEREFKRALELNPGNTSAHQWYAWYLGLMGRFDESIAELKRAEQLDPMSPNIAGALGGSSFWARKYDRAIEHYQRALDLDPSLTIMRLFMAEAYEQMGRFQEALAECQKVSLTDKSPTTMAELARAYAMFGRRDEAQKILVDLKEVSRQRYFPSYAVATIYTGLGDKERALEWLEKAYEERCGWMAFLKVDPALDSLRSDGRFKDLLRRVGLNE